ncbi:MAG: DUF5908 family protein [Bacteroidia bacterium]
MPIEIKELIIRAEVEQGQQEQGGGRRPGRQAGMNKEAIIKAAVEEVLRVLKEKESR